MAKDEKTANVKEITVQGVPGLTVSIPYAEGHKITEAEAKALNQTRAENVGNNVRAAVKKMLDEAGNPDPVPAELKKAIQALVSEKDAEYEFTLQNVGGGTSRLSPVETEARKMARDRVNAAIKEKGMTVKAYREAQGEEKYNEVIAGIAAREEVLAVAKQTVENRQKLANSVKL